MIYKNWPSFDELKKMAEHSPEQLEEFRQQEIESLISNAPKDIRRRLRGIQFQINCQRQIHKTPLGACLAISRMMRDSLVELNSALNHDVSTQSYTESRQDNIVPFAG